MKRIVGLFFASLLLASCATFSNQAPKFTFFVTSTSQDDLISVSVPSLEAVNRLTTGLQVVGMDVQIKNNSDKPLTVRWADSSIEYNGKSHLVFLAGSYYSDAGKPMPDTHIRPGRGTTSGVVPADNVPAASAAAYGSNQGPFDPIYSKDITCHIAIKLGDESRVYAIRVLVEGENQPQTPGPTPSFLP
jgi:hypothetical protein